MCAQGGRLIAEDEELNGLPPGEVREETELDFLARRAMEESRLAKTATSPRAAAAHSYLAAAYSAAVARELERQAEFQSLLLQI